MSSSTASVNRVHDAQPTVTSETASSQKRMSKLNDFMSSRSRTSSLPQRPSSSSGTPSASSRHKLGQKFGVLKGKNKDRGESAETVSSKAASSSVSVVDPFAANPTASSSFVPYSPTSVTFSPSRTPPPLTTGSRDGDSDTTESVRSQPNSPVSPTQPSQPLSTPTRRRGSILVAASDAFSSFARKAPMRSLHINGLGRQNSSKTFVNSSHPIVLTEVIEISESAVRASKLREEEEAERERLREAAVRALGINDIIADSASTNSGMRSVGMQDFDESLEDEDVHTNFDQRAWGEDSQTPTSTTLPPLPQSPTHSRSRSGSYIPPHILSLPARSSTPHASSSLQPGPASARPRTPKSQSIPPSSTAPILRVNTHSQSRTHVADDTPSGPVAEIPPFPSTPAALSPFMQLSGTMPRYYPAPSLLMFTLTKQWKNRYLVFTSPLVSPSSQKPVYRSPWSNAADVVPQRGPNTTPVPSFLHLFKTSGGEEKEVERLEINEESVVYIAEGEVGGRKGVIKVEGCLHKKGSRSLASVSNTRTSSSSIGSTDDAKATPSTSSDISSHAGHGAESKTMWVVHISNPQEATEWIGVIKGAVLNQRSVRAGLGMPSVVNGLEPRGDLDVVLSMRAQGLFPTPSNVHADHANSSTVRSHGGISPTRSTFTAESSPITNLSRSHSVAASTGYSSTTASTASGENGSTAATAHSANGSSSPIPRATTALKSLFTIASNRPRSPSTSSLTAPTVTLADDEMRPEDSFGHAGASLMGMNRSNSYVNERPLSPTTPTVPNTPRAGTPILHPEAFLERKILPDPDRQLLENEVAFKPLTMKKPNGNGAGFGRPREERHSLPGRVSSEVITSIALQPPPPRKRAGMVDTVTVSVSSPEDQPPPSYTYSHANSSTAESLGVSFGVKSSSLLTPPLPGTPSSVSTATTPAPRPKDRRVTRASWSSVSTYGSGEQSPSSPDESRSRWSRRNSVPHRMSPPYPGASSSPSSPFVQDMPTPSMRHPYASEGASVSRSSSIGSGHSRVSELHTRPFSSKRASVASMQSSNSSTHSYPAVINNRTMMASGRPKSAHRASLPPPQRPVPNSALPPTPGENGHSALPMSVTQSLPPTKSLRESLILRGNKRLSSTPPTLPPASALPLRPDEPGYRRASYDGHRRSSSSQGVPGSPTRPYDPITHSLLRNQAPAPPPSSPLPPRPHTATIPTTPTTPSSPTRSSSTIRRRLRILSSPPTPAYSAVTPPPIQVEEPEDPSFDPKSIPESPIIPGLIGPPLSAMHQNPSFLVISPVTPDDESALDALPQGLSPPPRRSSRQVATPEREKLQHEVEPSGSSDGTGETSHEDEFLHSPPPELDAFAPLLAAPPIRSSEQ